MKDPIRVTTATKIWWSIRRLFARSEWGVWLLGLKRNRAPGRDAGLILVQIDGLSRTELKRAIAAGRMPFLQSLQTRENYVEHAFYSGLPSSTPAVQAELYYGERTVVPAFGFRDHRTGRLVRMFASDIALDVEKKLQEREPGLLTGGSSYSNNYGGGAEDVHFCATSFGWSEFLKTVNPLKLVLVLFLNFWMFLRVFGLMVIEGVLATIDFVRGILSGRQFWQELIMIPARVVVVVLLRELVTLGACYDTARGLPVIHLNYLGYDEQAHRRGPDSRFAHWTLNRIDESIRQIWKAAQRSNGRNYDLWVFSDHGQERTTPYQIEHGKLVQKAVADVVQVIVDTTAKKPDHREPVRERPDPEPTREPAVADLPSNPRQRKPRLPTRADWLGLGWLVKVLFGEQDYDMQTRSGLVQTVTSGSIGFVYFRDPVAKLHQSMVASRLVLQEHVPMCAFSDPEGTPWVVTDAGQFRLPDEAGRAFENHPFLVELADDLVRLVRHEDAGDIVLIGWNGRRTTSSFVIQNGAHAGPGAEETNGFALLPGDTLLPGTGRDFLRPNDLRLAALRFLGRMDSTSMARKRPKRKTAVRILSYNVHACVGMDGQLSPSRIARVIDQSEADIVCLQELDVGRRRSGHLDQSELIARHLEMSHQFHPAWHLEDEQFGNAIMTRLPIRIVQRQSLHHHKADRSRRSALWAEVELADGTALQIVNTHLSIYPKEQKIQAQQLVEEWLKPASLLGPVILCGDFNARPRSPAHRILCNALRDIESFDANPTRMTLFSPFPLSRVDHGFVSSSLFVSRVVVFDSQLARVASDHRPLAFDVSLEGIESQDAIRAIASSTIR